MVQGIICPCIERPILSLTRSGITCLIPPMLSEFCPVPVPACDNNNKEQGYMWVRMTPSDLTPTSGTEYLVDLSDGDSNPSVSLRFAQNDNQVEFRYRDENGNVVSASISGDTELVQDTERTFGISWSNAEGIVRISSTEFGRNYTFTPDSANFNGSLVWSELNIGSRANNVDPFNGNIAIHRIGCDFLSQAELSQMLLHLNSQTFVGGGQSLMGQHWRNTSDSNQNTGYRSFLSTAAPLYNNDEIIAIDGSTGGSALSIRTSNTNYWWDDVLDVAGPAYTAFLDAVRLVSATPKKVLWAQGEAESHVIDSSGEITRAEYKALLLQLFEQMRTDLNSDIEVIIVGIGRRDTSFSNTGGIQTIREIQQELTNENIWIYDGVYNYDQDLFTDGVHLVDASYGVSGARLMRRMADIDGRTVNVTVVEFVRTALLTFISALSSKNLKPTIPVVGVKSVPIS